MNTRNSASPCNFPPFGEGQKEVRGEVWRVWGEIEAWGCREVCWGVGETWGSVGRGEGVGGRRCGVEMERGVGM